ncbi:assimilatory nitrate reductase NasA [Natrinema hispanicum]|uniref:Assimilatory nitrate reductase (Ferredoxin) n=1 Tax=Natrinema hispanicum TaxID=392421 RepID=A0A1G6NK00_9EURY|nr:assimilatory nitrate reductase (ferredoxin) precursor [Natrinema hispanicum]SET40666.1 assimilatory nitrate reductase (ferredoxin) precursor [Natrinema hispanicum]
MRCAVGCGLRQQPADQGNGLRAVSGDPTHPISQGLACRRGIRETADPDGERLTQPLVREDGDLVATTWEVALERATDGLRTALARSSDAVAVLGSGQQTTEAAYALGKLARGGIGTRYYDANTTLCMASAVTAYDDAFGSDAPPPTYDDIPAAESHVVWGANPAVAHPVLFRWIRQSAAQDDSRLIVVDPVHSETAAAADLHVSLEPGGDRALARGVLARVLETNRVDEDFVAEATIGFEALCADLPDVADAATRAGVSMADIERLADALAAPTLLYWGMGINQSVNGTAAAGALIDLCLATGNLRPGSGPFSLTGQANSMGTRVCSAKGTWPGHRPFDDPDHRRTVAAAWDVPVSRLPSDPGPGPVGLVDAIGDEVEAVYAVATNPVAGMPDATRVRERLADAFLIVQDAFQGETVDYADVVLPAATWGETEGTTISMDRTVSRVRAATEPPAGVRTDLELIGRLAERLVPDLFDDQLEPATVFDEFAALTAGTPADCSGLSYERLAAERAVRWPAPTADGSVGYRYYDGGPDDGADADASWTFPTPSGRARFSSNETRPLPDPPDDAYPLTLTTARRSDAYNTGVRTDTDDVPTARLSPATAAAFAAVLEQPADGPADDERRLARLCSRRAAVTVRVESDAAIPDGVVWLPIHHSSVNTLTIAAVDPRSKEPNFKQCAVRLEPPRDPVGESGLDDS